MNNTIKTLVENYNTLSKTSYCTTDGSKKIIDLDKEKDIKSKKFKIISQLKTICRQYIDDVINISNKYELSHNFSDEIQTKRGTMCIEADIKNNKFDINYSDSWAYGGYCDVNFEVSMKDVETFNKNEFIKSCIKKVIKSSQLQIKHHEEKILYYNDKIVKMKKELESY